MLACSKCGQVNASDQRFCSNCGSSLTPTAPVATGWRCASCGNTNEAGVRFCTECGKPQLQSSNQYQPQPVAPPPAYVGTGGANPLRVPDAMVATPMTPGMASTAAVKLWSTNVVFGVSFLLGIPSGIALAAINWRRLQMPNLIRNYVIGLVIFFFSLFLNLPTALYGAINIGFAFYLRTQMQKSIDQYKASGGGVETEQWWMGALIGLGVLFAFLILVFIVAIITNL
jgi:hypothetical protein